MKMPQEISKFNVQTTKTEPAGYHYTQVPDASDENMQYLIERHNELVVIVRFLANHTGFKFDGQEEDAWSGFEEE